MFGRFVTFVFGLLGYVKAPAPGHTPSAADTLRAMLGDTRYRFRKIETLAGAVGQTTANTAALLQGIGARPARGNPQLWRLEPTGAAEKLRDMLNHPDYKWRNIATLRAAVSLPASESLENLLQAIGARPARNNSRLWGLPARVGNGRRGASYSGAVDTDDDSADDSDTFDDFDGE